MLAEGPGCWFPAESTAGSISGRYSGKSNKAQNKTKQEISLNRIFGAVPIHSGIESLFLLRGLEILAEARQICIPLTIQVYH